MEFLRALGSDCEPVPISPDMWMDQLYGKSETDLPDLSFCGDAGSGDEPCPGRDFLTWLWFFAETELARIKHPDFGDFTLALEGPLTFAYSPGKAKDPELGGAGESTVKRGNPMTSAEAKAALASGKKLRKAKIMLARGDADKWTFTFDADTFAFGSLSLPEGDEEELDSRFEERITFLHILHMVMRQYFVRFVESVSGKELANTEKKIRQWARERESL